MNIIFLCTGNTCRSPMAEGIFKAMLEKDVELAKKVESVCSAGVMASNGDCATENAVVACKEYGADISEHRSQMLTNDMVLSEALFVCMTMSHTQMLLSYGVPKNQIYVLDVPDPYLGDLQVYRKCCEDIASKLLVLAENIKKA